MKKVITLVLAVFLCMALSACCLSHEWQEATCTAPKTCAKCQDTEGNALGHTWVEADCENAKICQVCGETEGEPLGHTPGEWEMVSFDHITLVRERVKHCTVCEKLVEDETETLTTLHEDGTFLLNCQQIQERMQYLSDTIEQVNSMDCRLVMDDSGDAFFDIYWVEKNNNKTRYTSFATIYPVDKDSNIPYHAADTCPVELHALGYDRPIIALVLTLDPTLTYDKSLEVLNQAIHNGGEITHNGIRFVIKGTSSERFLDVYIAE